MGQSHGVLLTGSTGFIGGELLRRLLARDGETPVFCLVRARDAGQLEARRRALLAWNGIPGPAAERVVAVAGDVTREGLGLGAEHDRLAARVDEIYHVAASTKFDLTLAEARAVNRDGAAHVLAFARAARDASGLRRLHHVSTAYVAGNREGILAEDDVPALPSFRNTYEQSKWESEQILDPERAGVPVTRYRPSIVVGDSRTGRTLHFRVLYDPMRWVYGGKIDTLPCRPEVRLDVVPVDWVCDTLLALAARDDSQGRTYHLTSGADGALAIDEIVDRAVTVANAYHREIGAAEIARPVILSPDAPADASPEQRALRDRIFALGQTVMSAHVPYMLGEQLFEPAGVRGALGRQATCPPLGSYFERIVRFGIERGFATG